LGIVTDIIAGLVAVVSLVVGQLIAGAIIAAIHFPFFSIILAIIGLFIAGFGLKRRGLVAAVIVGLGLGLAAYIVTLIYSVI
jgi:hypothetical protein